MPFWGSTRFVMSCVRGRYFYQTNFRGAKMNSPKKLITIAGISALATAYFVHPNLLGAVGQALIAMSNSSAQASQAHHRPQLTQLPGWLQSLAAMTIKKSWSSSGASADGETKHPYLAPEVVTRMPGSLRLFFELDGKSLRSEAEQRTLEALMISPEALAEAESVLTGVPVRVDSSIEKNHMAATGYLAKALAYTEGTVKEQQVLEACKRIILVSNLGQAPSESVKNLMIQDKAEVLTYLISVAPKEKSAILKDVAGDSDLFKVVQSTIAFEESKKAKRTVASEN